VNVFVGTSGLFAVLNAGDANHRAADAQWQAMVSARHTLACSNYVLLETFALVQNRLGIAAVRQLADDLLPVLTIEWVTQEIHDAGVAALFASARRQLSLVDCVSFKVMRRRGIRHAFAFDLHFDEKGFEAPPPAE